MKMERSLRYLKPKKTSPNFIGPSLPSHTPNQRRKTDHLIPKFLSWLVQILIYLKSSNWYSSITHRLPAMISAISNPKLLQVQERFCVRGPRISMISCCSEESYTRALEKQNKIPNTKKASDTFLAADASLPPSVTAPLVKALEASARENVACFHFPGHNRGKAAPAYMSRLIGMDPFTHDLPELDELDDLFSPQGVLLDAQQQASLLFGASKTWFLVGGTTCGIHASIMATCSPEHALVLPRNSHISAISAMVLSGAVPKYILPEYSTRWEIAGGITLSQVERAINELEEEGKHPGAVLVISPTYHGICSHLSDIAELCHFHGIPLIVDEAHGAHFRFHPHFPSTALEQGADITVQSTHKVLGSLTQSSMLHVQGDLVDKDTISRCLQMLQSSSPSYLLLASLDAARAQLSENPDTIFDGAMTLATETRKHLKKIPGVLVLNLSDFITRFPGIDPLRITIGVRQLKMTGYKAEEILTKEHNIIAELSGHHSLTFPINLGTRREDIDRLITCIRHLSATSSRETGVLVMNDSFQNPYADYSIKLSPREAFFAKKKKVNVVDSTGKICGELICPYPPGIPVLIPGEVITETALAYLLKAKENGATISGASDPSLSSIVVCNM